MTGIGDITNLTGIHLPRSLTVRPAQWTDAPNTDDILTMVVNITDTLVRPARWMDAPNTDDTITTAMNTADTTINMVIATVPAKRLSARTGLIVGTTAGGIIDSKTRE